MYSTVRVPVLRFGDIYYYISEQFFHGFFDYTNLERETTVKIFYFILILSPDLKMRKCFVFKT